MVRYGALKGFYEVGRTIGCGGFAKVKLGVHLATGEKVAIKILDKNLLGDDLPRVKLELKALKTFSHQHICKLYQVIETEKCIFIIVEYCAGGELFDHIVEKVSLSEQESRVFFRQIVLAVAYIHSLGYAHRDLKPENVLLDKDQSLKLIDFGLCAKPHGGMGSPLTTACGSPTYAAPELILGRQYLGTEVDVWAMGVILYTLLTGFLPFDDQQINSLYKKILSGKYKEPETVSADCKRLIKMMLQTDPRKRITVKELLSDPWLTRGTSGPLECKPENLKEENGDCVALMAQYNKVSAKEMWGHLNKWQYDYHTATYLLLLGRKKKSLPMRLYQNAQKCPLEPSTENRNHNDKCSRKPKIELPNTPNLPTTPLSAISENDDALFTPCTPLSAATEKKFDYCVTYSLLPEKENCGGAAANNFAEPRRPSSIRKPQKRIRSPNPDGDYSPVPAKKTTSGMSTPTTPERKRTPGSSELSGSARRVLGNIGRSFHRVRHALAYKKSTSEDVPQPAVLTGKELCNVSTTQCGDPEYVINELSKALEKKGIKCERKGFTIRGKMEPNFPNHQFGGCSFELEICYLPALSPTPLTDPSTPTRSTPKSGGHFNFTPTNARFLSPQGATENWENALLSSNTRVGIRRKRLKGDSWCYKKVCEQVLALTATDFKETNESHVSK